MAEAVNVLLPAEQAEFVAWMADAYGYGFDDLLCLGAEVFTLTHPAPARHPFFKSYQMAQDAGELKFYGHKTHGFIVTFGPGVEFLKVWRRGRKAAEEDEFDFLD